ncbi:MAG TPA: NAD(P)-dependent oxidoreductase [Casimicrobiaceae bacterium]|nr:NAD(P)-dependent oxidoreductase [Casimicrobiaceae bacterium]
MTVGFVGLGKMGKPMAMNLVKAGFEVIVSSATRDAYDEFIAKGARATSDPAEVAQADMILLCLPNSDVVRSVLLGSDGLAARLRPGQTVVDTSTITYTTTLEIAEALAKRGVDFMDAPVSGMEARAVDGTLTVMCGGSDDVFAKVRPLLAQVGNKILHMGGVGSGQLTKLINQLLFDVNCAALAEILPMAAKMGLDCSRVAEVVNSGTGRSYASEFFVPRMLDGGFSAGYPMQDAYKDLVSAAEIGARLCIPMPVLAAATATYQTALLQGHGEKDKGGMIRVFEDLLGVRFRAAEGQTHGGES